MGHLTSDLTRLRSEVDALRADRAVLMQALTRGARDLARSVAAMSGRVADDLGGARRAWRAHGPGMVAPPAAITPTTTTVVLPAAVPVATSGARSQHPSQDASAPSPERHPRHATRAAPAKVKARPARKPATRTHK
jgi:hypothetical protein